MHRTGPILLAAVALLTGCSPGSSTPATVTVPSPAPAAATSSAESTTPTDPGIFASQFHPCEVFTEEQFAEAGLGKHLALADRSDERIQSCGFAVTPEKDRNGTYLVATDQIQRERVIELGLDPVDWGDSGESGIYVHKMPSTLQECSAAVDFAWGRFSVDYMESGADSRYELLCANAVQVLESLIEQAGGN